MERFVTSNGLYSEVGNILCFKEKMSRFQDFIKYKHNASLEVIFM